MFTVSGPAAGGPKTLVPGQYVLMLVYAEIDDTKSFVLGTDDQPTTGLIATTFACEVEVTVPDGAKVFVISATFGPECAIEATPQT